eukprot:29224-Pelagococcus_subviridis.AAC.2
MIANAAFDARAFTSASPPRGSGDISRKLGSVGSGVSSRRRTFVRPFAFAFPEGRGSIQSDVGVEFIGVRSGVERRRGVSGLKAWDPGRRETPGEKVFKDRRSPRERGRMGTSV